MADKEEEERRNVCINVTLQLRTPLRELHATTSAHVRSNIPQSETAQEEEEEEEEEAAALQISRMQQVIYGSDQFDLKMC